MVIHSRRGLRVRGRVGTTTNEKGGTCTTFYGAPAAKIICGRLTKKNNLGVAVGVGATFGALRQKPTLDVRRDGAVGRFSDRVRRKVKNGRQKVSAT